MRRKQVALFIYLLGRLNAACMTELDTSLAYGNNGLSETVQNILNKKNKSSSKLLINNTI